VALVVGLTLLLLLQTMALPILAAAVAVALTTV
jgi:hypothetical protein